MDKFSSLSFYVHHINLHSFIMLLAQLRENMLVTPKQNKRKNVHKTIFN